MSMFDQRRAPPTRNPNTAPESEDAVTENLDAIKASLTLVRASDDTFAPTLGAAISTALKIGGDVRAAHFSASDAQEKLLAGIEKGVDAAANFQGGSRESTKIERAAVLRDAATTSARDAVLSLGPSVFGAPGVEPLAQRAAAAGAALEAAITRSTTKWRTGVGRVEELDDVVASERMKSILRSKSSGEVHALVQAMLSDETLDDKSWTRLDMVARDLAVEMLAKQPARDRSRLRVSSGDGAAFALGRKILDALDAEVEKRTPASIRAASDALDAYRSIFRLLVAPNASFMSRAEYTEMRGAGDRGLSRLLASWEPDPQCWGRFLQPRSFRLPGWNPISHTDRLTGSKVRKPR